MYRFSVMQCTNARRSLFSDEGSRVQPPRSFYASRAPDEISWQPGETLPNFTDQMEELKTSFHSAISSMQAAISMEISKLKDTVEHLHQRVADVETRISSSLESSLGSTPTSSSEEPSSVKRKRITPLQIQVSHPKKCVQCCVTVNTVQSEIRAIYNNLAEDKQLKLEEGYVFVIVTFA